MVVPDGSCAGFSNRLAFASQIALNADLGEEGVRL
jgi:hypothetical protein